MYCEVCMPPTTKSVWGGGGCILIYPCFYIVVVFVYSWPFLTFLCQSSNLFVLVPLFCEKLFGLDTQEISREIQTIRLNITVWFSFENCTHICTFVHRMLAYLLSIFSALFGKKTVKSHGSTSNLIDSSPRYFLIYSQYSVNYYYCLSKFWS